MALEVAQFADHWQEGAHWHDPGAYHHYQTYQAGQQLWTPDAMPYESGWYTAQAAATCYCHLCGRSFQNSRGTLQHLRDSSLHVGTPEAYEAGEMLRMQDVLLAQQHEQQQLLGTPGPEDIAAVHGWGYIHATYPEDQSPPTPFSANTDKLSSGSGGIKPPKPAQAHGGGRHTGRGGGKGRAQRLPSAGSAPAPVLPSDPQELAAAFPALGAPGSGPASPLAPAATPTPAAAMAAKKWGPPTPPAPASPLAHTLRATASEWQPGSGGPAPGGMPVPATPPQQAAPPRSLRPEAPAWPAK
ncbi:hypothetical protein V8C86DRAFT_2499542 [Haematococcus lacustris]